MIWILAVLTVLAYARTLTYGFLYDDISWISQPVFHPATATHIWPYLPRWPWALAASVGHGEPWAFHAVVLAVHLVNGFLLYRIARHWLTENGATFAVLLFWLHPLQSESVAYVSGGIEGLLACYLLLSVWSGLAGGRWFVVSGLSLLAAVTLKFSALPFLFIVPAVIGKARGWSALWLVPPSLAAVFLIGIRALPSMGALSIAPANVFALVDALWRYLAMVIIPWGFSIEHDWISVPLWTSGLALLATAVTTIGLFRCRWSAPLLAWLFLLACILPRVLVADMPPLTEHHTLIPFLAVWLLAGATLDRYAQELTAWHASITRMIRRPWMIPSLIRRS